MMNPGSKYVQLLQAQPSSNNGTTLGGLGHVLQQALLGYAMGQDQREEEAKQGRLTELLQMYNGTPDNTITWNQPTRPDGTGDRTTVISGQAPNPWGAINGLAELDPDLAIRLAQQQREFELQQDAANNELMTIPNPNGDGSMIFLPRSQVQPGMVAENAPPFTPDLQTLINGGSETQGYFDQQGNWVQMGSGPRWAPQQPVAANYTNFADRNGNIQSVDLSTDAGRATAQELTSRGYFEVGTNVNASNLGSIGGADVMPGPVDQAGKVIPPAKDYEWYKDEFGNWAQRVIRGTPTAQENEATAAAVELAQQNTLAGSERIIGTIDDAIAMVANQFIPITGPGGVVADALMLNTRSRATLEGALTTIKANLGFEQLQAMRDASPTGGALGQVAVQELEALQSTIANLNPDMGEVALIANLNKIKDHYLKIQEIIKQASSTTDDDALIDKYLGGQ